MPELLEGPGEALRVDQPPGSPPGHRPILREGVGDDQPVVLRADLQEGRREGPVIGEMRVDLVREDPQTTRPGEVAQRHHLVPRHDPAGGVRGRVDHDHPRALGQRRLDIGQRQGEAALCIHPVRDRDGHAARDPHRLAHVRPSGGGDDDLVAGLQQGLGGLHHRVHAARRHGEAVGRDVHAPMAGMVGAQSLAKTRQTQRGRVARMSRQHRPVGGFHDEGRRRQVAFADPELHHIGIVPSAIRDEADLARADATHAWGKQTGGVLRLRPCGRAIHRGDDPATSRNEADGPSTAARRAGRRARSGRSAAGNAAWRSSAQRPPKGRPSRRGRAAQAGPPGSSPPP